MRVKLAHGQVYWMLLDQFSSQPRFALNFENPGPIEINPDSLSKEDRLILSRALKARILVEEKPVALAQEAQTSVADAIDLAPYAKLLADPESEAADMLQANVAKCLEALPRLQKAGKRPVLEAMQRLEEAGKNGNKAPRVTLLKALEKVLEQTAGPGEIMDTPEETIEIKMDAD